ncbi:hypothetical protein BDW66DRAFT_126796, partial [Aspergillus desertorum]
MDLTEPASPNEFLTSSPSTTVEESCQQDSRLANAVAPLFTDTGEKSEATQEEEV